MRSAVAPQPHLERTITTQLPTINALLKTAGQPEMTRSKTEGPAPRPITP